MALKRYHITFNPVQQELLERLAEKWGLDVTNTLRHCVARVTEQEGVTAEAAKKADAVRKRTK